MMSITNNITDRPTLILSALTTLFLSLLSLTKKNNELNKLIIISIKKNINITLNMCRFFIYDN